MVPPRPRSARLAQEAEGASGGLAGLILEINGVTQRMKEKEAAPQRPL